MTAAGKTKGNKRKRIRTAGAKGQRGQARKARSVAAAPLKASNEAKKLQKDRPQQGPVSGSIERSAGVDVMALMNRRAQAYLELPARIARCNSPFQVWRVQSQFAQECFIEYAEHVTTFLSGGNGKATHGIRHD